MYESLCEHHKLVLIGNQLIAETLNQQTCLSAFIYFNHLFITEFVVCSGALHHMERCL